MKKLVVGMLVGASLLSSVVVFAGQEDTCEEKLRKVSTRLEITHNGRDQSEQALAELFGKYQDAMKQIEELKGKLPKEVPHKDAPTEK